MRHWIFFIFIALFYQPIAAQDLDQISQTPQWQRLLHLKKTLITRKLKSEIDSPNFFIHPDGSQDALKELEATIAAFKDSNSKHISKMEQHPQCAFPARLEFLKKYFKFPEINCTEFNEWKKNLPVKSVHLVFSTAYPNNPASTFGHTFIRLGLSDNRSELLDYAINFSADTGNVKNGFTYTMMGLFGGFDGFFSLEKYYLKVNDYNNQESRDLWEYKLSFNSTEIDMLLKHFWELYSNAYITYFFMDENCSYHLLTLIEVAKPSWNLSERFYHPGVLSYTLPADTIKQTLLAQNSIGNNSQFVSQIEYRPSKRKILLQKRDTLNPAEKEQFYKTITEKVDFTHITNPFLLDTIIEYYDYKKRELKVSLDSPLQTTLSQALAHRSQLGITPPRSLPALEKINQPDLAHESSSIGFFSGVRNDYSFTGIKYRFGLHDLLNSDEGYDPYTQIDYLHLQAAYSYKKERFFIDELKLFDISSINTYDPIEWKWSWRVLIQSETLRNKICEDCLKHYAFGGGGAAFELWKNKLLFYIYALGMAQYSKDLSQEFQYGPGLESALLFKINSKMKTKLRFFFFENLNDQKKSKTYGVYDFDIAYQFNKNWDARLLNRVSPRNDDSVSNDYSSHFLIQYYY